MKIETEKHIKFVQELEKAQSGSALKFFANCSRPERTLSAVESGGNYCNILNSPSTSFCWTSSNEGYSYWRKIWNKVVEY